MTIKINLLSLLTPNNSTLLLHLIEKFPIWISAIWFLLAIKWHLSILLFIWLQAKHLKSFPDNFCNKNVTLSITCECKKNYKKDFDKDLIRRFANKYGFCDGEGVYSYKYIDSLKRFDKTALLEKEHFIVAWIWKTLQMLIIDMKKEYLKILKQKYRWLLWSTCFKWYIITCRCI